jgi:hypothetical protein
MATATAHTQPDPFCEPPLAFEQIMPSHGNGMNVQAGHPRDPSISTPSEQHRLEPREETPLALVEQAEKQHQGSLALIEGAVASLLHL